jgi:beta-glucosidase
MKKFSILAIAFIAMMQQFSFSQGASISTPQIEDQVNTILNSLSLEEKVGQTCQITLEALLLRDASGKVIEPLKMDPERVREAIVEYGVGSVLNVNWHTLDLETWEDVMTSVHKPFTSNESSVPVIYGIDAIHGANYVRGGTLFPQEIGLAATWNETLAMQFGEVTAYETRAAGIPWNFSPVLDLGRQPLWSRHFETLGEDPYLASKMGKAIICGYQGSNGISREHVASCMKHFVGYSNPVSGRDRTPAWIP